jgi:hypothetical protein
MHRLILSLPVLFAALAEADRITEMNATERCVYKARLAVAGYHYFLQGKPRREIAIRWHGDETDNEIAFVTRTLDEAYSTAEADQRERPEKLLSDQAFGDRSYNACMSAAHG